MLYLNKNKTKKSLGQNKTKRFTIDNALKSPLKKPLE